MASRAGTPQSSIEPTSTGHNREDQLLDIARRLFANRGFHATSLRDIAEEAKITKAALYYHFPNKDELYERVVIQSLDALVQMVAADVARAKTPTDRVRAFMHSSAHFLDEHREHWLAGANAFREAGQTERRGVALHLRDTYEKLLRRCVSEGIEAGEFREVDAAMTTRFLLSGLNYVTRWHSPTGKLTVKEVMGQFVDMALLGLAVRGAVTEAEPPSPGVQAAEPPASPRKAAGASRKKAAPAT
ncbi:TetR/AcrR family transcriptional regulator [Curvibacter sp. HBC61]|uniref:TetR/AcrR family transcriptional regulator n=1 Tax=Curvibacter cyanobacteriorum TaxID=3026422 RepID=A0ABT5MZM6_9BURK|nr:TetR/AcrR family transcriptional regulator [Curvibacter sp. HBC61]MDD0838223.1 TetR/AcrR family transcriptional regulator [Curvibacter sp. HBC61]